MYDELLEKIYALSAEITEIRKTDKSDSLYRAQLHIRDAFDIVKGIDEEDTLIIDDNTDDAYALASAGHGTDEDYGYFGEE